MKRDPPMSGLRWLRTREDLEHILGKKGAGGDLPTPQAVVAASPAAATLLPSPNLDAQDCLDTMNAAVYSRLRLVEDTATEDRRRAAAWVALKSSSLVAEAKARRATIEAILERLLVDAAACRRSTGAGRWCEAVAQVADAEAEAVSSALSTESVAFQAALRGATKACAAHGAAVASSRAHATEVMARRKTDAIRQAAAMSGRVDDALVVGSFREAVHPHMAGLLRGLAKVAGLAPSCASGAPTIQILEAKAAVMREAAAHFATREAYGGCTTPGDAAQDLAVLAAAAEAAKVACDAMHEAALAAKCASVPRPEVSRLLTGRPTAAALTSLGRLPAASLASRVSRVEDEGVAVARAQVLKALSAGRAKVESAHARGDQVMRALRLRDAHVDAALEEEAVSARSGWDATFNAALDALLADIGACARPHLDATFEVGRVLSSWRPPVATLAAIEQEEGGGAGEAAGRRLLATIMSTSRSLAEEAAALFEVDRALWLVSTAGAVVRVVRPHLTLN